MFCPNCGSQVEDGVRFCPSCGADMGGAAEADNTASQNTAEDNVQQAETYSDYSNSQAVNDGGFTGRGTSRNIVVCIILSIITCGIYCIYWMYVLNEEINSLSGEENATGGGMVILFSIITCGIYTLYWYYKMGERVDGMKANMGTPSSSSHILYLVLGIFGLGIVNYVLMQDTINKAVA
ncbi:MAG: DUF4234 domain-containing protein [Lachnospiraceae bacterium]|nr:DUF4234 domain-containing protein [Lachnospiraceae bacterium]